MASTWASVLAGRSKSSEPAGVETVMLARGLPPVVAKAARHSFVVVPCDSEVEFYVKEDDFTLARYPSHCTLGFRLAHWDDGHVICIALLVRLGGTNLGTFDRWINPGDPVQLRILQLLAKQHTLALALVSKSVLRTFQARNTLAGKAAGLVATLRVRRSWSKDEFEERRIRLDKLYPTSPALWRGTRDTKK